MKSPISVLVLASLTLLSGCSGPSREELARIKSECASFHKQERAKYSAVVKPIDHWTKDGRIVVELSEKESESSSKYTSHLCVYDKETSAPPCQGAPRSPMRSDSTPKTACSCA